MSDTSPANPRLMVARLLGHLRVEDRAITVACAEVLLLIAGGIDHASDLAAVMIDSNGKPMHRAKVCRLVSLLRGRDRYKCGRGWVPAPFSLVETRKHPHRRGLQLRLNQQGRKLVDTFMPSE